jgi:predicted transcriptional regulator
LSRPEPCTTVAARIEPSLYDQLTDLAARARCSRSALVRRLIKEGVKRTSAAYDKQAQHG